MPATSPPPDVSLLYVATVALTIRLFLLPYVAHFRALGWRVDAAASGVTTDDVLREAFDHVYEVPFSRSIRDVGALIHSEGALWRQSWPRRHDIVHVHTPIAALPHESPRDAATAS